MKLLAGPGERGLIAWNGPGVWPEGACIAARTGGTLDPKVRPLQILNGWWWLDNLIYWTQSRRGWREGRRYIFNTFAHETKLLRKQLHAWFEEQRRRIENK